MSTGGKSIGIPIKLLHEAEGHTITLETKTGNFYHVRPLPVLTCTRFCCFAKRGLIACDSGEVFRGQLLESEDNMNCYIGSVTMTARDGRTSKLEQVAIRGSQVPYLHVHQARERVSNLSHYCAALISVPGAIHDSSRHAQERTYVQACGQDRLWSWQSGGTSSGYEDSYRKAIGAVTFLSILPDTVG